MACCSSSRANIDARLSPLKMAWDVVMRWFPPSFDESCSLDHRWFYNEYNSFCVIADRAERFVRPPFLTVHPFGKRAELLVRKTIGLIEYGLLLFVEGKHRRTIVATQDGLGRGHALVSSQF